jgi:YesN/AraC family two-component response regulator
VYTLFLVEDEELELDLLREHIDWAGMDIRVVGAARNGRRAWEQIQEVQPDIVLTDVRMPIMDGLRLALLIQERFDWMKIVFLSGHDEFAYVKSAIESGAVGYLLKPVDPKELSGVMVKVKEEVAKANMLRLSKQMLTDKHGENFLLRSDKAVRDQAWLELTSLNPSYKLEIFASALISVDHPQGGGVFSEPFRMPEHEELVRLVREQMKAVGAEGIVTGAGEGEWFVLVCRADGLDAGNLWHRLSAAVRAAWEIFITIGICDREGLLSDARNMLFEARKAAEERFYLGHGHIVHSGDVIRSRMEPDDYNDGYAGLLSKMNPQELPDIMKDIDPYFERLIERRIPREQMLVRLTEWLRGLSAELVKYNDWPASGLGDIDEWEQTIARQDTLEGVKNYIVGLLHIIRDYIENKQQDRHAQLMQEAADIIHSQYAEQLTIEYLAGRVYLSPNYFRALFKEKKGCTVHEYLTRVRLQKALELLRDRTLKIKDVAIKVGFDNTSYFCSFFYKTQGVTPNEYRKKFL